MPNLYVIRHAPVQIDPTLPSTEWLLSEEGKAAALQLAQAESTDLADVRTIYHSPEPKAEDTAHIFAKASQLKTESMPNLNRCEDLRELEMDTGFLSPEEFQARVGAYLAGAEDLAFEPYESAKTRIVRCVHQLVQENKNQSLAIVTHGRILTVLYSHLLGRRLTAAEWKSIRLPDISVIDTATWQVTRGFLSAKAKKQPTHKEPIA